MKIESISCLKSFLPQPVVSFEQKVDNWVNETYGAGRFHIAEKLKQYSGQDELCLNLHESESLPDIFNHPKFATLKILNLNSMKLEALPNSLIYLKQLEHLYCKENKLKSFPEGFFSSVNLEKLILSQNRFIALPEGLNNLRNLKHLDLSANRLTSLQGVGLLSSLEVLKVAENHLDNVPVEIGHLTKLKELNLDSTQLEVLPSEINTLSHLEKLFISNNKFTRFPSQIGLFKKLYKLDISHNKLESLEGIGGLSSLTLLNISYNKLRSLSEEIGNLTQLLELDISYNKLTQLHPSMGSLKCLRSLEASNNGIRIFPEVITGLIRLEILNLNENRLERLSQGIGLLKNLEELVLNNNYLGELPSSLGDCVNLRSLHLSGNPFENLPPEIGHLQKLTHLFLNNTFLVAIPPQIGQLISLEELSLKENIFNELPLEILDLNQAPRVNLQGTPLLPECVDGLHAAIEAKEDGYQSPRFMHMETYQFAEDFDNELLFDEDEFLEVDQCLETIYVYAGKEDTNELLNLFQGISEDQCRCLHGWLNKVIIFKRHLDEFLMNNNRTSLDNNLFYQDITNILELANENNGFKDVFWAVIVEGSITCGDRIALSIADLHIQKELIAFKLYQHQSIASLFKKGVWAMELSDEVAKKKIEHLRDLIMIQEDLTQDEKNEQIERIDEVEIRLGYLLRLKDKLNLAIEIPGMLYYGCSNLTEEDIQEAETVMLEKFADQDAFIEFLLKKDLWKQVLEYKCARQMNLLKEAYEASDSEEAHIHYLDSLKKLTKELLEKPQPGRVGVRELNGLGVSLQAIEEAQQASSKPLTRSMAQYRA